MVETAGEQPQKQHLGAKLKSIREKKGLKIDFVSGHTKIRWQHIEALEQAAPNSEATLPSTYYRGYLKTYCQFFGVDISAYQDEINQLYPLCPLPMQEDHEAFFKAQNSVDHTRGYKFLPILGISFLLLTLFLALKSTFLQFGSTADRSEAHSSLMPSVEQVLTMQEQELVRQ